VHLDTAHEQPVAEEKKEVDFFDEIASSGSAGQLVPEVPQLLNVCISPTP